AVESIRVRGWQIAYRHVFPPARLDALPIDETRWRGRFVEPPAGWSTFVAEEDDEILGFASIGPSRDEAGIGELYAIYVDPDSWSRGAGRALLARAEETLASTYAEATLWVLSANMRARRFYEQAGWRVDGASKSEEHLGVSSEETRYRKTVATSSRS
ncbi:MAG TPA: GNAT family N-acetyltransferase, partial [Gaiellaceae bacterium]|nr:GNAT family N-acetyltransferase [Gaiellaceae bacterium]